MKTKICTLIAACCVTFLSSEVFAQNQQSPKENQSEQDQVSNQKSNTQNETPVKIIEYIPGTWVIQSVFRGDENVSRTDTLAGVETIEFNREGRYMTYSGTEQIDSGAYRLNEQHGILYMASEGDNEKPMEWKVSFTEDGAMTMKAKDSAKELENLSYVYRKTSAETSSNRKNE